MTQAAPTPVVQRWRQELLDRVLHIALALGVVAGIPSIGLAVTAGRFDIAAMDVAALAVVGTVTFVTTLPYRVRAMVLLLTAFGLGLFFTSIVGLVALTYLLAVPVLAAVLLGFRAAVAGLVVNAVALAAIGLLDVADPRLATVPFEGPTEWLVISINFLFMDAVMALSCALLLERMERSLVDEQALSASLQAQRATLDTRNRALEREMAERRRAEEQQRFQAQLLDAVGEAVIATDVDGIVRYVNPAAVRLYGWPAAEALGRPVTDVTVPATTDAEAEQIMAQVHRGETWTGEFETTRRDGTAFPALVTNAPYRDSDGRLAGVIGVSADISRLRETINRLARSEEIRTAFLRATSHELRTPLAAIVGFAETLHRHGPDLEPTRRADLAERLVANAERLTRLVTDLLDVDRLTSGIIVANRQPHELDQLIRRVVADTAAEACTIELDLEPVTADVDGPKIERVVANLVANAVRHTPPDGTIRVVLRRATDGTVLQVNDTGPGIDPAYLDLVFDPFVQGPERHDDAKPGTGLGLTLTRELVRLHDGQVTATNLPDGGACLQVHLPDQDDGQDGEVAGLG